MERHDAIQAFLSLFPSPRYLEIGVEGGYTFHRIKAARKVAVDPTFRIPEDQREAGAEYREITSDAYFATLDREPPRFDVIYIDGLHTFEQSLRDLINALSFISDDGFIILDDVIPSSYQASISDHAEFGAMFVATGSQDGAWMGDVYRLVFFIQSFLPQFTYATIEDNHGQLVMWRGRREGAPFVERRVADIAKLEYRHVVLHRDAFNVRPHSEILAMAQRSHGDAVPAGVAEARRAAIRAWCVEQTQFWRARGIGRDAAAREFAELNRRYASVYLFDFADGEVSIAEKPEFDPPSADGAYRSGLYKSLFAAAIGQGGSDLRGTLAMDMEDDPFDNPAVPIFAFQNTVGRRTILLPDMDFLGANFYEADIDDLPYEAKAARAIFVGATTGSMHTLESVQRLENHRIRSAVFFRDSDLVDFRLLSLAQCTTPEAEAELRRMGFGGELIGRREQLANRLLLSMDGNGATCSRVAVALKSNSALVKYDSPHRLFYFSELVPWRHFIPVSRDEDVLPLVELERAQPGYFRHVAEEGRRFYETFLTRDALLDYTVALLRAYFSCFVD